MCLRICQQRLLEESFCVLSIVLLVGLDHIIRFDSWSSMKVFGYLAYFRCVMSVSSTSHKNNAAYITHCYRTLCGNNGWAAIGGSHAERSASALQAANIVTSSAGFPSRLASEETDITVAWVRESEGMAIKRLEDPATNMCLHCN